MNCKNILLLFFFILASCVNTQVVKENKQFVSKNYFSNKGFALVYSDKLKKEKIISNKIDTRSLIIFQKNLKKNTKVKITNLINQKSIIANVGKKSDYPNFYNSVISIRISEALEIDQKEPYVEIKELIENSLFVAIAASRIYIDNIFKDELIFLSRNDRSIKVREFALKTIDEYYK